jgi:hypothetical protein
MTAGVVEARVAPDPRRWADSQTAGDDNRGRMGNRRGTGVPGSPGPKKWGAGLCGR